MPNYSKIAGPLAELLSKLPAGSKAAQEAIAAEMAARKAAQEAAYAAHTLPTETGKASIAKAKKTLRLEDEARLEAEMREKGKQKFLEPSKVKERLYHATPKDFKEFQGEGFDPSISGHATWLSTNKERQPAMHNIGTRTADLYREGTNVMPVHVQATNPLMLDTPEMEDFARQVFGGGSGHFPTLLPKEWADAVKEAGYDSIVHPRSGEVIMLDPRKIKSAIGNRGTYDINDPDITKAHGGLVHMAEGGVPEKRDVSQLFPINPNIGREPVARTRAGVPVQDTNVLGGALQGLGETLLGAGRGYTATALGGIQDLLNMVDIPQLMTGESYQIPYGSEYFKEKLPLKPTTQTGEVAQELGSFLPLDPTQVVKSGYKAAKTVGKAIAPTAAEMALDLAEKGGAPVRQFAVPPEGKLSKEEYSRMMREKYAAENAAKQAKKEAAPVTMANLKPKEEKVPADKLGFYSPAEKAAANLKRNIADGELMLSDLKKFPDVTPDELAATGLEEWLKSKKTVTKQQVKDYMAKNKLELEEVKYEQGTGNADDMRFGSGEVIDDYDYISSRADDIVYDWDYIGHESRDDIRARILEDADPEDAEHLVASGKIDDLVEEEVGKLANEYAADEYYDNPYRRYRNDMGYEIVGNDDVGYHVTDPNGNHVRMNREAYDVETAEGYAREDAMNRGFIDEGETKYHEYQLPGGENYREILLKTPSKKQHLEEAIRELEHSMENPGNDPRELREMQKELDKLKFDYKYAEENAYEGSHWDEPNVIAHMRLQDRVDSEGNKILYVDEMQSDWHQEGRRAGYKTKEDSELIAKVKEKRDEASDKANDIWNQRVQRSRELAKEFADSQDPAVKALGSTKYMENDKILNDFDNAYNEASKVTSALNKELSKYTSKVPKGPFADNWHKLALKRVMKYAADNGYTRVGFSKAQPQVNRWGTDVVAWDKNPAGGWVVTATEQRGGRAGNINLEDDARARGILQESKVNTINNRDQLYATVAKISRGKTEEELQKLTDRIWKQMQEKDAGIVAPREAGMKKFYDEELEGALKKYANQFKGKYGQTTLDVPREGKQTINYIDITPDLKKSTIKGQPYKVGGAVRMADGGPVNLDNLLAQAIENAQPKSLDHLLHQALVKSYAEGGAAYNTTPDMADGGQFIQGEAF